MQLSSYTIRSHIALFHASCFRDICFPLQHGLSHSADIRTSHILAAIHLTVRNYSLPRVVTTACTLHRFIVFLLQLLISLALLFNLLLSLTIPLIEFLLAVDFSLFLQVVLLHHFIMQCSPSGLFCQFSILHTLPLLIIKVIIILLLEVARSKVILSWDKSPILIGLRV